MESTSKIDPLISNMFGPGWLEEASKLYEISQQSPTERWKALREAVVADRHIGKLVSYIDLVWKNAEDFELAPGVLLLAQPYHNSHSRFHYVHTVQIHLEIGCVVLKRHDNTGETLSKMAPRFEDAPEGVQYVAPMQYCPYCQFHYGPLTAKHDALDPISGYECKWMRNLVYHLNAQIHVGVFDPKNVPEEIRKVLTEPTYDRPMLVNYCGESPLCPGFNWKASRAIKRAPKQATLNFFKMTDATSKIKQQLKPETSKTESLKTP